MRRGALMAAGGLVAATAAGTVAIPGWARWLGEQMEKLQPKPRVEIRQPVSVWTYGSLSDGIPEGPLDLNVLKDLLDKKQGLIKFGGVPDPDLKFDVSASAWPQQGLDGTVAVAALTYSVWLGLKEG